MVGQLLAEQAAIALKSGLEFHSWSTREAMMSRVRATASALLQELNLRQLISATQRACKDLLKATHAAIYLVEREDGGGLIFKEGFDSSAEPLSPKRSPCFEILKQVAADGLVAIIPDASKDERFDSAAEEAEGGGMRTRALMAQALRNTAGRVIGVMEVSRAEDVRRKGRRGGADAMPADAFSWEDTEALGMLCSVTSVALENARLAALCQRTPGTVLHEINRVCVSGMQKAMPSVLSRLNQAKIFVPCKLVRIFLKVEDAHEVWVYDSSQENPGAHPARVALAEGPGPVRAAFKSKRTSIQQIGGAPPTSATPNKNGSQDGVVKGHRKVAAMGGVKTRANLSVAPLPAAFVAPDKASGTLVFPPCVQGDEVKYVITAPAYTHDGGPVVAVVQVRQCPGNAPGARGRRTRGLGTRPG